MDALAHPLESVFHMVTRGAQPPWHQNLVAALLSTSGGLGQTAVDAHGNRALVEQRARRFGDCADLVVRRLDRFGAERDATPIVIARRLDASGEFHPKVGLGPEGHFVVAWQDLPSHSIMARRYSPIGAALGPAFAVNSATGEVPRINPLVAVNSTGAFIVLWEHAWTSIRARIYAPDGAPLGEEIDIYLSQHLAAPAR